MYNAQPSLDKIYAMVTVAQLVEPRIVIPAVAGSSPVSHPIVCYSDQNTLLRQSTLALWWLLAFSISGGK